MPAFDDEASHLVAVFALIRLGATVLSRTMAAAGRATFARELERAVTTVMIAPRPGASVTGVRLVPLETLRPAAAAAAAAPATPIDRSIRFPLCAIAVASTT